MPELSTPSPELQAFVQGAPAQHGSPALPPPSDAMTSFLQAPSPDQGTLTQTAIEGGMRGLTFGLSDAAAVALGEDPEGIKSRERDNPLTSTVSQIAGALAPLAFTGGAGAAGEAAGAGTEGALSGIGQLSPTYGLSRAGKAVEGSFEGLGEGVPGHLLGMGLEGAGYGAGNVVSDAALGDPDLTAQKVLSTIGMGAAFGSGLGALSKVAGAVLPASVSKLGESLSGLKEMAVGTPEEPGFLGKGVADWSQKLADGFNNPDTNTTIGKMTKVLQDIHASAKEAANDIYEKALPANIEKSLEGMPVDQAKSLASDVLNKVSATVERAGDNGEMVNGISSPQMQDAMQTRLATLSKAIEEAETSGEVHEALRDFATSLNDNALKKSGFIITDAQQGDKDLMDGLKQAVRGSLKDTSLWGDAAVHYAEASENYSTFRTAKDNFQKGFMTKEAAAGGGSRYVIDPGKVKSFFNNINDPSMILKKGYLNDFVEATQRLSKASENYYGFEAAKDSISNRVVQMAKQNSDLQRVAQAAFRTGQSGISQAANTLGELGLGGIAHGAGASNPVVGGLLGSLEAYKAVKNPYQTGATLGNIASKLGVLGDISQKVGNQIEKGAKNIFAPNLERGAMISAIIATKNNSYEKRTSRINELMADPQQLMNHLSDQTANLMEAAPNVSASIQRTIVNSASFLKSKMPAPVNQMPLDTPWEATPMQKQKFQRYYDAVSDPISALKEIKNGSLSNETMEALQAVHPQLLEEMKNQVLQNLNLKKAVSLNYGVKIALSKFLGQPLDSQMLPRAIQANQAALQAPEMSQNASPVKGGRGQGSAKGMQNLGLAQRSATETQDLEDDNA